MITVCVATQAALALYGMRSFWWPHSKDPVVPLYLRTLAAARFKAEMELKFGITLVEWESGIPID